MTNEGGKPYGKNGTDGEHGTGAAGRAPVFSCRQEQTHAPEGAPAGSGRAIRLSLIHILWQLRDVAIIGVAFLISVLALAQTGTMLPLVGTVLYAFLAIQVEGSSVLDFLRRAEMCIRDKPQRDPA